MSKTEPTERLEGIAVIGMAGRFPGAKDIEAFWKNVCAGTESVHVFSDEELLAEGIDPALVRDPNYVKASAVLDDIEWFDAGFFGYNPREAEVMDPQQRLFLEVAWEALERAGYDAQTYGGLISVFAGAALSRYLLFNLLPNQELIRSVGQLSVSIANDKDHLATRASYKLNLKGGSVNVSTACSTSLLAVHMAAQSLLSGECDMALAGGVSVAVPQKSGYTFVEGGIFSPDGHCRAFDHRAQGTVAGSGLGVVVLKRLEDAVADGDLIYAVIKGSAFNNDGSQKVSYTAPSVEGQSRVIAEAYAISGIDPATVGYVEAHGTGTELGDPIEITALTEAYRTATEKTGYCAIGSVKTNIGHLDAAAGVAGFIKTVLSLHHKMIPPSLHFEQPNPKLALERSPFVVNTKLKPWAETAEPRRAGVSSFGLGGTNVHVVLEEAPLLQPSDAASPWQLLVLSAKTDTALESATDRLVAHLKQTPGQPFADVAYTLQAGRRTFEKRRVLVCRDAEDALSALASRDPKRLLNGSQGLRDRAVAFLFTGVGDQYVNMAFELYRTEPVFQKHLDRCCELLQPHLGLDLREVLFDKDRAEHAAEGFDLRKMMRRDTEVDPRAELLKKTIHAQPAMFAVEYALSRLLIKWGIHPQAMLGHSLGEYVAACLAGVLSLEDALFLVAKRAQLIQTLPGGAMLAVPLSAAEVSPLLGEGAYLGTINAPSHCVVSGTFEAVERLERQLTARGVTTARVQTTHAFHSPLMEPALDQFLELVKSCELQAPEVPYLSNVTGTWATEEVTRPEYWGRHLCQPVRFADCVQTLCQDPNLILLEVGPGVTLSGFAQQAKADAAPLILPTLRSAYDLRSDRQFLLSTLGQLWLEGVEVDWEMFHANERRQRVLLPTYPFERQRYWIDPIRGAESTNQTVSAGNWQKQTDIGKWFYTKNWKRTLPLAASEEAQTDSWLVFANDSWLSAAIIEQLEQQGQTVMQVHAGDGFSTLRKREYTMNPKEPADYERLIREWNEQELTPRRVVHLWNVSANEPIAGASAFDACQQAGFFSLIHLTKALAKQNMADALDLFVVADNLQEIESGDALVAEKATLLGPCKIIPQEYRNITCRVIDVQMPLPQSRQAKQVVRQLLNEFSADSADRLIAYRGQHRWVQTFDALPLKPVERPRRLRERGVYLIAGGLGTMGRLFAKYLAKTVQAKLVLTGRSGLPAREQWAQHVAEHGEEERVSRRIRQVQELEQMGADVLVLAADVAEEAQMRSVIEQAVAAFGRLDGVIHAAGLVDEDALTPIAETGEAECEQHFRARVQGSYVIARVLEGRALDFCLCVSSLSAVLGGIGHLASASAHLFMDAFAHNRSTDDTGPWLSFNWELGTPEEMLDAIGRAFTLEANVPLIVSMRDLESSVKKWIQFEVSGSVQDGINAALTGRAHARPNLHTGYVAPRDEGEQAVAEIFQELLGIEQIGIHDSFFQLGGNSLLGTQLVTRLRSAFQVDLPLRILFEASTVEELTRVIEVAVIAQIAQMSDEELLIEE